MATAQASKIVPSTSCGGKQTDNTLKGPLLNLHRGLCEIESTSQKEQAAGRWLAEYLKNQDLTVDILQIPSTKTEEDARFNVHAYIGKTKKTRALYSSHIDTVPPYWPYEVRNNGTEIWGRGVVDDKGPIAAQVMAFKELREAGAIGEGDVGLLFVVGEEDSGDGMLAMNDLGMSWEAIVFGEPTEGKLVSGHKGILDFTIKAYGKASHSGYPSLGISANDMIVEALAALRAMQRRLDKSDKYGESTLNIGRIDGGVAPNVLAETAEAKVLFRIATGTPEELKKKVEDTVHEATKDLLGDVGKVEIEFPGMSYGVVDIDHDVPGFETMTVCFGTDIPNLIGNHKKYLYGPGSIQVAHSDHEQVLVSELVQSVEDYKKIMLAALKK